MINNFTGKYSFLSNFFVVYVYYEGITYANSEAAFQAAKLLDLEKRKAFAKMNPREAKRQGRRVDLREDWELVKDDIMYEVCKSKFQNPYMREKLLATGNEELVEGNNWNDTYWGVCRGVGENKLGKILMRIREEEKENEEETSIFADKSNNGK